MFCDPGLRPHNAQTLAAVVAAYRATQAIRRALARFKVLCNTSCYFNFHVYQEWRHATGMGAVVIPPIAESMPPPQELKVEVSQYLALLREGPKSVERRSDVFVQSPRVTLG